MLGRVILQYRITGDHGIRATSRNSNVQTKLSSTLLGITFITTLALTILSTMGMLEAQISTGVAIWSVGVILAIVGISLTALSQYQMGKSWRLGVDENERTKLVTHGLYSRIRNPIYTGVMVFGTGLLLLVPHLYMLLCMILGYISIDLHVRYAEEPYLLRLHGDKYKKHAHRTGRYLPNFF